MQISLVVLLGSEKRKEALKKSKVVLRDTLKLTGMDFEENLCCEEVKWIL